MSQADPAPQETHDLIERRHREAVVTSLRFQASTAAATANHWNDMAEMLLDAADAIAGGKSKPDEVLGHQVRKREEGEAPAVPRIYVKDGPGPVPGDLGDVDWFVGVGGEPLPAETRAWLDRFNTRFRESPHFIRGVNAAADAGLPMTELTARIVAAGVQEAEERERAGLGDEWKAG